MASIRLAVTTAAIILGWCVQARAQALPPIFAETPVALATAEAIATLPVNTFLENLVVDADGTLYITSHETGQILSLQPGSPPTVYATVAGKVSGIAQTSSGQLLVTGWDSSGMPTVFRVAEEGSVEVLATLPEAIFLNGMTPLEGDRYLIADSYRGVIWELDAATGNSRIWLDHPLLARRNPDSPIPAANGLKLFNGTLYASNTEQMLLLQIPVTAKGEAGEPQIWLDQINIDDFTFAADGTLYGATHIYNSLVQITPDGTVTTIAQAAEGMTGSTAVAFAPSSASRLYVVTNGGMFLPPPTGVEPAVVVQLEVMPQN